MQSMPTMLNLAGEACIRIHKYFRLKVMRSFTISNIRKSDLAFSVLTNSPEVINQTVLTML
jgi:hypothetical protein